MDGGFALLLFAAVALSGVLSWLQHRAYLSATRRLTAQYQGQRDKILVSGRGKGWTRGAVVLMVIDSSNKRIVAAEAMVGVTIFARFRLRPELLGGLTSVGDRAGEKRLTEASRAAVDEYRTVVRRNSTRVIS